MKDPETWSCGYCRVSYLEGQSIPGRLQYPTFEGHGTFFLCYECATVLKEQVVKGRKRNDKNYPSNLG